MHPSGPGAAFRRAAFAGPDLPVPEVREVGLTPSGRAYAISVRHHGRFLEDTPAEQAGDRELAALSAAVTERVRSLAAACPERRGLVYGDLLHGNVLVGPASRRSPRARPADVDRRLKPPAQYTYHTHKV